MPGRRIVAAPNGIYRAATMVPAEGDPTHFLYVGRLIQAKKPFLLLDAFLAVLDELEPDVRLVFVGDGPLADELRQRSVGAGERVCFEGHVSDVERLRDLYANAISSVSPGYVGLSITQSLGFGVPMIVARDEPHSPEIEAAVEGMTAMIVPSNDPRALGCAMLEMAGRRFDWLDRRPRISDWARQRYSVEEMSRRLASVLSGS
jgi:glycosyltransferase involved in cell wall biosynthesis